MSDSFKALVLNQEGENYNREIKSIDKTFLKHGDVLVKVCLLYTSPSPRD